MFRSWSVTPPQLPPRPGGVGHGPRALAPLPACGKTTVLLFPASVLAPLARL